MALNWTPDVIETFIIFSITLILTFISLRIFLKNKLRPYLYFGLTLLCSGIYMLLDGLANLYLNTFLKRFDAIFMFGATIFLVLLINYTWKISLTSLSLIPLFCLGTLLCYSAFQPAAVTLITEGGYPATAWFGLYNALGLTFEIIATSGAFIWVLVIWLNSPFEIKREASILLFGSILLFPLQMGIYMFAFFWHPLILVSDFFIIIGFFILLYIMRKEPKVLYVLPFTPYRIFVKDRKGILLAHRVWSKSKIDENKVSYLLTATRSQSNKIINGVDILDIHLNEGVILFQESKLITPVLIVSKSSNFLKDSLKRFSVEFEAHLAKSMQEPGGDASKLDFPNELIRKYFSIFPSRLIDEETQPLFLSKDVYKIPSALETKLKHILKDEEELELVKCEIQRSLETHLASEFLALYKELKEEMDRADEEITESGS